MKRQFLAAAMALTLALCATGCGDNTSTNPPSASAAAGASASVQSSAVDTDKSANSSGEASKDNAEQKDEATVSTEPVQQETQKEDNNSASNTDKSTSDSSNKKASSDKSTSKDTVTKPATCDEEGVETWVCENCGDSYTTSIPATGEHTWVEQTTTIHHDEVGHYETQVIEEAYDEPIKETKQVCNYKGCGAYFDTVDEVCDHIELEHDGNASYSSKKVVTGTIHHDAVQGNLRADCSCNGTTPQARHEGRQQIRQARSRSATAAVHQPPA